MKITKNAYSFEILLPIQIQFLDIENPKKKNSTPSIKHMYIVQNCKSVLS
jgi:hypothetical protein